MWNFCKFEMKICKINIRFAIVLISNYFINNYKLAVSISWCRWRIETYTIGISLYVCLLCIYFLVSLTNRDLSQLSIFERFEVEYLFPGVVDESRLPHPRSTTFRTRVSTSWCRWRIETAANGWPSQRKIFL